MEKVIWSEGLLLGQQHFQQWENYHDKLVSFRANASRPYNWGVINCKVCDESLKHGMLRLTECDTVLSTGRVIRHNTNSVDLTLNLSDIEDEAISVYLCVPANDTASGISGYRENGSLCAWKASYKTIPDIYDGEREREVAFATPNIFLMTSRENRDNFYNIKLYEIRKLSDSSFTVSDQYIPPCIHIGASASLVEKIRKITELVQVKARIVSDRRKSFNAGIAEFGINDLQGFVFLGILSEFYLLLDLFKKDGSQHPFDIYKELARMYGALCTLTETYEIDSFPTYMHHDLGSTFRQASSRLEAIIEKVMPSSVSPVRLIRENDNIYTTEINDSRILESSQFFLSVMVERETTDWITEFGKYTKVASRREIEDIVISALPGITLRHIQRPPSRLPIKAGYEYFMLEKSGDYWKSVVDNKTLSVFVTNDYIDANIEIICIDD
jgi:type VI secretion system protein ImpJ